MWEFYNVGGKERTRIRSHGIEVTSKSQTLVE